MMGKDESVTSKEGLLSTQVGRAILKDALFKSEGYRIFNRYKDQTADQFQDFKERFARSLLHEIKSDRSPAKTQQDFADQIGTNALMLSQSKISDTVSRLSDLDAITIRVDRILDSNFVKMTFPVFNALYDAAASYSGRDDTLKRDIVEGHILAIDLSEPMDRIVDKDEDLEYLDDYRLMNPYILKLAKDKIKRGGDAVYREFERGFEDARAGQYADERLKSTPMDITEEAMEFSYKKYRAIMGTAGRNMALAERPLGEIFYSGMAHAAEAVGCGNEIEDSVRDSRVKIPSWPLYYTVLSDSVKEGFAMTLKRSRLYLSQARISLELLPKDFTHTDFLKFLFMTVEHYTEYWHVQMNKRGIWDEMYCNLPVKA